LIPFLFCKSLLRTLPNIAFFFRDKKNKEVINLKLGKQQLKYNKNNHQNTGLKSGRAVELQQPYRIYGSSISSHTSNILLIGMVFLYELILPNCLIAISSLLKSTGKVLLTTPIKRMLEVWEEIEEPERHISPLGKMYQQAEYMKTTENIDVNCIEPQNLPYTAC
jgi:hypothetical protein